MRNVALAFVLGLFLGRPHVSGPDERAPARSDTDAADLRFVVELGERANDRVLDDIRAFNAVAYALLGPLLAIAAFVDYRDLRNAVPLGLSLCAIMMTFDVLRSRDGLPSPSLADVTLLDSFADDPALAMRNVLGDLRHWGIVNARIRDRKRGALLWASRFVLLAIIATAGVKGVESGDIMRHASAGHHASLPAETPKTPGRKPRSTRFDVAPSERHSYAYDRATGKPVTDEDVDAYLELINRPWWRFW